MVDPSAADAVRFILYPWCLGFEQSIPDYSCTKSRVANCFADAGFYLYGEEIMIDFLFDSVSADIDRYFF